ncbi:MAG: DHHA1 domain-containing protein [Micrococcales bacterium]
MSLPDAREWGAVALFGETYDEEVRVIQVGGPWSRELCGGTHVSRSSQIGLVSIINESSVGSGSRRLEALVGMDAFRAFATERALVNRLYDLTKAPKGALEERLAQTLEDLKVAQRNLARYQAAELSARVPAMVAAASTVGAHRLVAESIGEAQSVDDLRALATQVRDSFGETAGVAAIFGVIADKPMVVVAASKAAQAAGAKAGALVRAASAVLGGGGGGKDDIAQGGGSDAGKIGDAIAAVKAAL